MFPIIEKMEAIILMTKPIAAVIGLVALIN